MIIELSECDLKKTIFELASEYTTTGNISLAMYGDKADNWINGYGRIPYIQIDGEMHWNISIKNITIYDLAKTFQLNIDNNLEIELDEVQNWGAYSDNLSYQNNIFKKILASTVKTWKPNAGKINVNYLLRFIEYSGVQFDFVLDAIWLRDLYSMEDFINLFSVTKKEADNILRCAGYIKKRSDKYYILQMQRKQNIIDGIEKTFGIISLKSHELNILRRVQLKGYKKVELLGEKIAEYGRKKNYFNINTIDWNEPALKKSEDTIEKVLSVLLIIVMLSFVIVIVGAFMYQFGKVDDNTNDSLYGFWGSIAGSMIAGLITIFTTYFIIQRSYKIDYHQERMAVLPFFETRIMANHFSTELGEVPKKVKKIINNHICFDDCIKEDAMLIEFKNVGRGPAFQVVIEGLTDDYNNPLFQSIVVMNKKYVVCYSFNKINIKVRFCDVYGNYYYQCFVLERNSNDNESYCELNATPPELLLRTKKTRYIQ